MKGAFWDPERDFRGRRILGGLLGEPYHAHTSSIDMYNNDVGKKSAPKIMKQTGDLKAATMSAPAGGRIRSQGIIIACLRQVVAFAPHV